jgi:DNA-binding NtrC family response regulator
MGKILLVEDQKNLRRVLAAFLKREGHSVEEAENGQQAIQKLEKMPFDLVLTDWRMEPVNGLEVLRMAKKIRPKTEVVVITAYGTVSGGVEAMKLGAYDYLQKPVENDKLKLVVERAIEKHRLATELERLQREIDEKYNFENIIGKSDAMRKVLKLIPQLVGGTTAR